MLTEHTNIVRNAYTVNQFIHLFRLGTDFKYKKNSLETANVLLYVEEGIKKLTMSVNLKWMFTYYNVLSPLYTFVLIALTGGLSLFNSLLKVYIVP